MTVIINELEHIPAGETRAETGRDAAREAGGQAGRPGVQQAEVMSLIRREASRLARLWAD